MNYNKKTVKDIDVSGKKVLLRCDFNVPQDKTTHAITDDKRIRAAPAHHPVPAGPGGGGDRLLPPGKPKGEVKPELSLKPVAERLSQLLGKDVIMAADVVGPDAQAKAAALKPGEIMLLENTRFEPGETKNDPGAGQEDGLHGRRVCVRRLRRGPPRPRLHRRRGRPICPPCPAS